MRCINIRVMGASKTNLNSCYDSIVSGTNDREACSKYWIAVLVQMNCERKSAEKLSKLGIECYVPVQEEIHRWTDRKKKIYRILIPMVVFIRVDDKEKNIVRNLAFIQKIITYPGQKTPAIIPDSQISQLRYMIDYSKEKVIIKDSSLRIGDKVKVVRGVLKGLEGFVYFVEEKKSMVAIRIDFIGYACVNISINDVEQLKNYIL